jgi:hypothetical protein
MSYYDYKHAEFSTLVGKTIGEINNQGEEIEIQTDDGKIYKMYHSQDCCESVSVEEIVGDLNDLLGSPVLLAEEVSSTDPSEEEQTKRTAAYEKEKAEYAERGQKFYYESLEDYLRSRHESETWTFYKLSTIKGSVTIRWYGSSNGYYSEAVSFVEV